MTTIFDALVHQQRERDNANADRLMREQGFYIVCAHCGFVNPKRGQLDASVHHDEKHAGCTVNYCDRLVDPNGVAK